MTDRWYVVHTKPSREYLAREQLERQSFQTFMPLFREKRVINGRLRYFPAVLFPSYLFVRLDIELDRWRAINGTRGVNRMLGNDEMPKPLPTGWIEGFQARLDQSGLVAFDEDPEPPKINEGDAVEILSGPLSGYIGICKVSARERVQIMLSLLGRQTKMWLHRDNVAAISGAAHV